VLKPEGQAADAAAKQLETYRIRVLMMQFDKNKDGRITKDEMPSQSFLDRMDGNKDGVVTAQELSAYEQQRQPPTGPSKPSADAGKSTDEAIGSFVGTIRISWCECSRTFVRVLLNLRCECSRTFVRVLRSLPVRVLLNPRASAP